MVYVFYGLGIWISLWVLGFAVRAITWIWPQKRKGPDPDPEYRRHNAASIFR